MRARKTRPKAAMNATFGSSYGWRSPQIAGIAHRLTAGSALFEPLNVSDLGKSHKAGQRGGQSALFFTGREAKDSRICRLNARFLPPKLGLPRPDAFATLPALREKLEGRTGEQERRQGQKH